MKMKKQLGILGLLLIGTIAIFTFNCCDGDEEGETIPAMFGFKDNLAMAFNSTSSVAIEVYQNDIEKMEVLINDSVVQTWKSPKKQVSFSLNTAMLGIGAKNLDLRVTYDGGKTHLDQRLLRILSDVVPENWSLSVVSSLSHNTENFTQGLEFDQGVLYESTGQQGQSKVAKIDLNSGKDITKIALGATHFGEGITVLGDVIYQLTWTTGKCFMYNKNTLEIMNKDFSYTGEGWGLCNDGKHLIMSDGSERITFRNPKTFTIEKTIEVYTNNDAVVNLNELEYIDGFIFANIWMTNKIVVIDPANGKVIASLDGTELVRLGRGAVGDSFNGIAYNELTNKIYMTGKKWEKMFEVKINKPNV